MLALTQAGPLNDGVLSILRDPEIYARISDDRSPPIGEFIPPDGLLYLLGTVDDQPASLFVAHGEGIHFMTLKRHRWWARELLSMSIDASGMRRMFCEIPSKYREVINFAKRAGFQEVSVGETFVIQGGVEYPRHRLVLEV